MNFLLSGDLAIEHNAKLHYRAIENRLISGALFSELQHRSLLIHPELADSLHTSLEQYNHSANSVSLSRDGVQLHIDLTDAVVADIDKDCFDCVFHDAFSPKVSPALWTRAFLGSLFDALRPGGCIVTYCAKGQVRRDLASNGALTERLPGPPGKREMLRAWKASQ